MEAYEQALARAPSPQAFREFLADEAPEIARLVPKLRQLCPDIPPPLDLPPEQERRYLFNSVWEVLARTARIQPVLLVLDDIHWADEPTMLLVAAPGRARRRGPRSSWSASTGTANSTPDARCPERSRS